ncbi:uncharacterized protein LOC143029918 isoform X2 [Oratosquilla oratoria]|uniref:uncharacterized protein LOC143029918 isoform X2 n=1 Tax=Oratosquilla oratoria TaxID=337810 RepID=UPI003F76FDFF
MGTIHLLDDVFDCVRYFIRKVESIGLLEEGTLHVKYKNHLGKEASELHIENDVHTLLSALKAIIEKHSEFTSKVSTLHHHESEELSQESSGLAFGNSENVDLKMEITAVQYSQDNPSFTSMPPLPVIPIEVPQEKPCLNNETDETYVYTSTGAGVNIKTKDTLELTTCTQCGNEFHPESEEAILSQKENVSGDGLCPHCQKRATSKPQRRSSRISRNKGNACSNKKTSTGGAVSKKYSCDKCDRVFTKLKYLAIHYSKEHEEEENSDQIGSDVASDGVINSLPVYCCKICNVTCSTLQHFKAHGCRLPSEDGGPSSCSNLFTNVLKLHKLRKFVCELCHEEYRTFKRITYHLPRCLPGPYPCQVCSQVFNSKKDLNYHKKKVHRDEKSFVCEECGKCFKLRTSLQKHAINWHESGTAQGPFKCDVCPKKFIRRIYLTNHKIRMHGLDKKFVCQMCGNKFMTQNSLTTHMEIHSDVKKFKCGFCDKKFKRKEKLKYHERIHTGERPYLCQLCGRGFVSKSKLDEHVSRHRGDRRYRCQFCPKTYAGSWDLKQHVKKAHDKVCDKVAVTVVAPVTSSVDSGNTGNLTQVQLLDPLAIATAASGLEEDVIGVAGTGGAVTLSQQQEAPQHTTTLEEVSGTIVGGAQYITLNGQPTVTIPVVQGQVQGHVSSLSQLVQVSGSSVPLASIGAHTLTAGNPSVQAVQTLAGVTTTEYPVHSLQPQAVHTAQGYIFTQGFDVVNNTIQY